MKLYFKNNKLQKICSNSSQALKSLGSECAGKLQQRLLELSAARMLQDVSRLPPARCHELTGDKKGVFSVDLRHPYRLLFIVLNEDAKYDEGGYDWSKITEIQIIDIQDTH